MKEISVKPLKKSKLAVGKRILHIVKENEKEQPTKRDDEIYLKNKKLIARKLEKVEISRDNKLMTPLISNIYLG